MSDPLLQCQDDFYGRLVADEYFADVAVLKQRDGVIESDINTRLATLNQRSGKLGALVIVLMPDLEPKQPNVASPECDLLQAVQIIESPLLNLGAQGTGKTAEQIGARVRRLLHHFYDGSYGTWYLESDKPVDRPKGQVSRGIAFRRHHQDEPLPKAKAPVLAITGSALPYAVELSCATSGAAIYYTLDGSYPAPEGGILYTAAIDITVAATLRATATADGYAQSDIAETEFS